MSAVGTMDFGGVTPIFRVGDLEASVAYYVKALGFNVVWSQPGIIASVSRGRCSLMLVEGDQGHPGAWAWVGVPDCAALFAEYSASGAKIRHPPANYSWAYEMQVEDPDGNVLRCGSDPLEGEPFGPWLDMHGTRWIQENGRWKRME